VLIEEQGMKFQVNFTDYLDTACSSIIGLCGATAPDGWGQAVSESVLLHRSATVSAAVGAPGAQ